MTRREALRLGCLTLVLSPWSDTAAADASSVSFEFVVINDTHYVDEDCRAWQRSAASAMRQSAPAALFCAHAGDMTDRGDEPACATMKEF